MSAWSLVGVSAAETANPEKNIPSAINKIPLRILFFYVGALFVLLCINPWTQLSAAESPFVRTFSLVGIPIAAGIINFVVLTSAASACNSGMFSTSRILYNLSRRNQASPQLGKLNRNHVPANSLFLSTLVISAGALLSKLIPGQAFGIVTTISAIASSGSGALCWSAISSIKGTARTYMPLPNLKRRSPP